MMSIGRGIFRHASQAMTARHSTNQRSLHNSSLLFQKASLDSIKQLRARTGAPINAVKQALEVEGGDMDAAMDHLRKLGASIVAKNAHRDASEGLISIAVASDKRRASIIELNSETDFVARTPQFNELSRAFADSCLELSHEHETGLLSLDVDRVLSSNRNGDRLHATVSTLRENIVLKRAAVLQAAPSESIFGYVHGAVEGNSGRIGVVVALAGDDLNDIGPRVAMHIAAASPLYVSQSDVPDSHVTKERNLLIEAAEMEKSGARSKGENVIHKMAEGRLRKWFSEVVLEEQEMLVEGNYSGKPRSVTKALRSDGRNRRVTEFARFVVGEKM